MNVWGLLLSLAAACCMQEVRANLLINGADPDIYSISGNYWIYPTSAKKTKCLFAYSSRDLHNWIKHGTVLRLSNVSWARTGGAGQPELWAPGIFERDGLCFLYFSVGPQDAKHPSQIGVALGDRPGQRFIDSGKPLITGGHDWEATDPMAFTDPKDGSVYLYCGGSAGSKLHVFRLGATLTEIKEELPVDTPINFTEGAYMHKHGDLYYLSYSHGRWDDESYSVHYSTAHSALGPWTYKGIILQSDTRHAGPGHHAIFKDLTSNQWYIVYHRWNNAIRDGRYPRFRSIAIEKISYSEDGAINSATLTDNFPRK